MRAWEWVSTESLGFWIWDYRYRYRYRYSSTRIPPWEVALHGNEWVWHGHHLQWQDHFYFLFILQSVGIHIHTTCKTIGKQKLKAEQNSNIRNKKQIDGSWTNSTSSPFTNVSRKLLGRCPRFALVLWVCWPYYCFNDGLQMPPRGKVPCLVGTRCSIFAGMKHQR